VYCFSPGWGEKRGRALNDKDRTNAVALLCGITPRFCLPFDVAQDERQHGTFDPLVCSFSALRAEKLHTIEKEGTALPKAKTPQLRKF
jgi:hypothetical protein